MRFTKDDDMALQMMGKTPTGMGMRFKVVQLSIKHRTVNRADPTSITKRVKTEVLGYYKTAKGAKRKVIKEQDSYEKGVEIDMGFSHGECGDLIPNLKFVIVDRKTGFVYEVFFGDTRYVVSKTGNNIEEAYPTKWRM